MAEQSTIAPEKIDVTSATSIADLTGPLPSDMGAPVGRLHADNFMADDLDGITESLFGSGQLNYLMMQSRQTDSALMGNAVGEARDTGVNDLTLGAAGMGAAQKVLSGAAAFTPAGGGSDNNTANTIGSLDTTTALSNTQDIIPALNTSNAFDNQNSFETTLNNASGEFGINGTDGTDGDTGNNGNDGTDGTDGNDGNDGGTPPDNGGEETDTDLILDLDGDLLDTGIIDTVTEVILDPVEQIAGDIDINIGADGTLLGGEGSTLNISNDSLLGQIPLTNGNITLDIPLLNNILPSVTEPLTPVLDNIGNVLDIGDNTLNPLGGLNDFIPDPGLLDALLGSPDDSGDTDLVLDIGADIPGVASLDAVQDVILDPVENIVGDIDIDVGVDTGILNGDSGLGVSLNPDIAGLDVPEINADLDLGTLDGLPVVGNLTETVTETLTNPEDFLQDPIGTVTETVSDTVENVTDVVDNALDGLLNPDAGEDSGDTDLTLDLGLVLEDNTIIDDVIEVGLDPVESLVGDIDIDVGVNTVTDLLDGGGLDGGLRLDATALGNDLVDDLNLDLGLSDTEGSPVTDVTDTLDNLADGDVVDNLLDPVGDTVDTLLNNDSGDTSDSIGNITDTVENTVDTLLGGDDDSDGLLDLGLDEDSLFSDLPIVGDDTGTDLIGNKLTCTTETITDGTQNLLEEVVQTLDDTVDDTLNLVGDVSGLGGDDGLLGGLTGDTQNDGEQDSGLWPENLTNEVNNTVDGFLGGDDSGSILPDPVGTLTEGLGLLDTGGSDGGGGGGLLGGLFG